MGGTGQPSWESGWPSALEPRFAQGGSRPFPDEDSLCECLLVGRNATMREIAKYLRINICGRVGTRKCRGPVERVASESNTASLELLQRPHVNISRRFHWRFRTVHDLNGGRGAYATEPAAFIVGHR